MPSSTDHISFERLADLAEQRLPTSEAEPLLAHLEVCADCAQSGKKLDHLIGLMQTDDSVDAPQPLMARALNIFQRPPERTAVAPRLLRRLVATLSFDSFNAEPAFGLRSGQTESRQLIFSAEDLDIDLRIAAIGDRWNVSGQVLGGQCATGAVQLESETAAESAELNEQCEFVLSPVTSGNYHLRFRLEDLELEIPQLELKK